MLKALRKPLAAAVVVGLLLMYNPNSALAASGGRMGGRLFSSSRSSASTQSSSTPRNPVSKKMKKHKQNPLEIMAGDMLQELGKSTAVVEGIAASGGDLGGGSFSSTPRNPISKKMKKHKQNPLEIMAGDMLQELGKSAAAAVVEGIAASGGDLGGGSFSSTPSHSYSTPPMGVESGFSFSDVSSPAAAGLEGTAASEGDLGGRSFSSASSQSYSSPPMGVESEFSFSDAPSPYNGVDVSLAVVIWSSFSLLMIAFVALVLVSRFLSDGSHGSLEATEKTSVFMLQVGLLGLGRSLQKDLNRIAEIADTSTPTGLHYVLTETVLALLRHPDYCISGYSSVDVKRSMDEGEKKFNQLSIEERGKFDEETLVNVNNIKKQSSTIRRASGFSNEYIVITILVAAEGDHKLPPINNSKDLKDALQKLASIPSSRTMAVEVLWTPQNEDDTLSERELLEDYPLLRPL